MTKYYIFRHGETFYSKNRQSYPEDNFLVEILPEEIPVLEKLAIYLKNISSDYNVSSEYFRCQQSIKIVSEISRLHFENDSRLNEFNHETFEELVKRLENFVKDIEEKNYSTVIICSHGAVIAGLKNILTGSEFESRELINYPKTGILTCIEDKKIEEVDFNKP